MEEYNMKKITSMICAIALALTLVFAPVNANAATAKSVYFTVEKLTIGQGLLVQPMKVEIKDGDTVQTVFEKAMKDAGYEYTADNSYGFYLTGIKKADSGKIDIPKQISDMPDYVSSYEWDGQTYSTTYKAPSNEHNDGNANAPDLNQYAYNAMAGWMFMVNNKGTAEGADKTLVNDGDVIRLHFSVFGWGDDVGIGFSDSNLKLANKDELVKKIANVKDDQVYMSIAAAKKAYEDGVKVLEKFDATDAEVSTATNAIAKYEKPAEVKVARAQIKSIKNIKGKKAKITVKKIKDATGYVFKYSKYKSFKKATKKTTKKTTIKTKKFKKKQKCYAKVQAYKTVNGVKHFGKWSKVKKVKIKK